MNVCLGIKGIVLPFFFFFFYLCVPQNKYSKDFDKYMNGSELYESEEMMT